MPPAAKALPLPELPGPLAATGSFAGGALLLRQQVPRLGQRHLAAEHGHVAGQLGGVGRVGRHLGEEGEQALVEAGLEGTECDGEECAARVGRLLGATTVVTGRVIRAMTLIWGVDVRVTDVETGRNLRRQAAEFKGDYLVLKTLGMRQLAREVAGY